MVAYSFKRRFVVPIRVGLGDTGVFTRPKLQTIRADRRRHARPGEELQLYCGMRTKGCFLIGRATCREVCRIWIAFDGYNRVTIEGHGVVRGRKTLDSFAQQDGFGDWFDFREFWKAEHGALTGFNGVIIYWIPPD